MKNVFEVSEILNIEVVNIQNMIKKSSKHRKFLDKIGCYKKGNNYLFNEEGIKYIAYQYVNRNDECLYCLFPDMKPKVNKQIKNVKVNRS